MERPVQASGQSTSKYWIIASVLVVLGMCFSIFLVAMGNKGGWGLMALMALIGAFAYFNLGRPNSRS